MRFIRQAYLNRRYTRLVPSCVIAVLITLACLASLPALHGARTSPLGTLIDLSVIALQAALYPFARETYFRLTGPIRASMPTVYMPVVLWLILGIGKLFMFLAVMILTIPLGTIGFAYLSISEYRGNGYRFG